MLLDLSPPRSRVSSVDVLMKPSPNPALGGSHAPSRKGKQFYCDTTILHRSQVVFSHTSADCSSGVEGFCHTIPEQQGSPGMCSQPLGRFFKCFPLAFFVHVTSPCCVLFNFRGLSPSHATNLPLSKPFDQSTFPCHTHQGQWTHGPM